jgi:N-acetylmuramoyl-L-alanine amidase
VTRSSWSARGRARGLAVVAAWALGPAIVFGAGAAPPEIRAVRPRFVVAVDPGHGGSNLGAAGAGGAVFEKQITLELARRLRDRLRGEPPESTDGVDVVLCRDRDVLVPIRARARCVQQANAALFISLHANATPPNVPPGTRRGFEIYVLPPDEVAQDAALAGLRQVSAADAAWAGHRVRAAAERSAVAARVVEAHLRGVLGPGSSRGIRQAGASLDVLRGTGAPSLLIEIGFLDHPEEGAALASAAGQERIAGALASAVLELSGGTKLVP